ncbi:MAG: acylphosphatase [Comamonas sp.]
MSEMPSPITRRLRIRGLVQRVYYRQSMVQAAERLGLSGWVRNRSDGSVEALATGPAEAVQALIDWAHAGPPAACVDGVEVSEAPPEAVQGFAQRETI